MKRHRVRIVEDAERDLIDIYNYVSASDSAEKAKDVLDRLERLCESLSQLPERGHVRRSWGGSA